MEYLFHHLDEFVQFVFQEWSWVLLLTILLLAVWYREASSPLPDGRPPLGQR